MKKLILAISTIFCLSGCNYLDIVPDDTPLLEDAFKNEQTAEGFMLRFLIIRISEAILRG